MGDSSDPSDFSGTDYTEDDSNYSDTQHDDVKSPKRYNEELDEDEYKFTYKLLSPTDIVENQNKTIEQVNFIFQLPFSYAKLLLQHFSWDQELLMEKYYDNPEALFSEVGLVFDESKSSSSSSSSSSKDNNNNNNNAPNPSDLLCEICFIDFDCKDALYSIGCKHFFCLDCWDAYLESKIMVDGLSQGIECPETDCKILVNDFSIEKLVVKQEVKLKYMKLSAQLYVTDNKRIKSCPFPGCEYACQVNFTDSQSIECKCGKVYCFQCVYPEHVPLSCELLKKWLKKCLDDSETANWLQVNTKECPKCKSTVEKTGGCNHMTCKRPQCKYEYCWLCLGEWAPHGTSWYNCNRFEEESASKKKSMAESRSRLQRYLHYYNRYKAHEQSLKFESVLRAKVAKTMSAMQDKNISWIEVQSMKEASDILHQCRVILKHTYVFAFYLSKTNQSFIFEENQKNLEFATEELSHFLEHEVYNSQDFDEVDNKDNEGRVMETQQQLYSLKQSVVNKGNLCKQRANVLKNHVKEGYDEDYWEFDDDEHMFGSN